MPNDMSTKQSSRPLAGKPPVAADFRHALGHFATGITVITMLDEQGILHGLTANAVSSVSLEPPLILFCIKNTARSFEILQRRRAFCLHILTESQKDIAMAFASSADRSTICEWTTTDRGLPLLDGFHMALQCTIEEIYPGGDHGIVLARVHEIHAGDQEAGPLLFYKGQITSFSNSVAPRAGQPAA